jgi:murein DD-endopeptidase MepM/ murein hydrolase activator NlpD
VHAAGDGRVAFEGVRGGYGNAILLSHSSEIQTLYGHMSRFARVHVGSHVRQGEVIGYVGMTGLATGPHLHYEYLMNGVHKDPQTVKLPGAEPLPADAMDRFHAETARWLDTLAAPQPEVRQAGLGPSAPAVSVPFFATDEPRFPDERRKSVN